MADNYDNEEGLEPEEDNQEESEDDGILDYDKEAQVLPERKINLDKVQTTKEDAGGEDDEASVRTDLQAGIKTITPKFSNKRLNEILQPIMLSDIPSEQYMDYVNMLSVMFMEESYDNSGVDFMSILTAVNVAVSLGHQKKHVIDVLEMFGAAREDEMEMKKLSQTILGS